MGLWVTFTRTASSTATSNPRTCSFRNRTVRCLVKITDLGIALAGPDARITAEGAIVGTAAYLAPEQALGVELDGRADLYALGVILYELFIGRPPFSGENALAVISQHLHAPVVPLRSLRSDIPDVVERLIMKLLAKDPNDRYDSAEEVESELADRLAPETASAAESESKGTLLAGLVRGRLVGRQAELDSLRQIWLRSSEGHGQIALVSGEPGAGKTRLSCELTVVAQISGATVLSGGCYEYEATTPYLPFVEALRQWVHRASDDVIERIVGASAAELARLAPELNDRLGPFDAPSEPRATGRAFTALRSRRPFHASSHLRSSGPHHARRPALGGHGHHRTPPLRPAPAPRRPL